MVVPCMEGKGCPGTFEHYIKPTGGRDKDYKPLYKVIMHCFCDDYAFAVDENIEEVLRSRWNWEAMEVRE